MELHLVNLLILAILSAVVGFFLGKIFSPKGSEISASELEKIKSEAISFETKWNESKSQISKLEEELKNANSEKWNLNGSLQARIKELEILKLQMDAQKKEFQEYSAKMSEEFKKIANEVLINNSQKFQEQTQSKLGDLLNPLKENILNFEKKVEENSKENKSISEVLKDQIKNMLDHNQKLLSTTDTIASAFRNEKKKQGDWGETILINILEHMGFTKDRDFVVQDNTKTDEGSFRPDIKVFLPDQKMIVIDSKVSQVNFMNYNQAESEEDKKKFGKLLSQDISNHVEDLAKKIKNYTSSEEKNSLEFVLMFVPNDVALNLAMQFDEKLYANAFKVNVILVSQLSLYLSLKLVQLQWKQDKQNKNAYAIAKECASMLEKFSLFLDSMDAVGKGIHASQENFESAMKQLSTGKGNLISKAKKIEEMGVSPKIGKRNKLLVIEETERDGLFVEE